MTSLAAPLAYLDAPPLPHAESETDRHAWNFDAAEDERRRRRSFADHCAVMTLELRTALEDRLPRLAALAACWFDDEDGDGADGPMDGFTDPVTLRIDLDAFAAGLVRRDGQSVTPEDAVAFLDAAGFQRLGDLWVGDRQDLRLIGTHGVQGVTSSAADA